MPRAMVIGGGIGGLTTGIALQQTGWDVAVFERAPELREVGAGLTLWTNAVKVLQKLGLTAEVTAASHPIRQVEMRTWKGRLLVKNDYTPLYEKLGAPTIGIHRADLQSLLADTLGRDRLRLGAEFVGYAQNADGVTARFADGREERGDVLIGADGIKSVVRKQLLGDEPLRYAGYTAWRGVGLIDRPEVPLGVTFLAMGRGSQVGMLPIGGGRTYWFATANVPPGQADEGGHRKALLARFGDWYAPFPAAVEATPEAAILRNDIYDRPPVGKWSDGRATLLGDAAHPTTPNLGQGACQAIESAYVLAKCLKNSADIPAALLSYEQSRFARTALITNRSWTLGKVLAYESTWACGLRDLVFRLLGGLAVRDTEKLIGVEV